MTVSTELGAWVLESSTDERAYPKELDVSDLADWAESGDFERLLSTAEAPRSADPA